MRRGAFRSPNQGPGHYTKAPGVEVERPIVELTQSDAIALADAQAKRTRRRVRNLNLLVKENYADWVRHKRYVR